MSRLNPKVLLNFEAILSLRTNKSSEPIFQYNLLLPKILIELFEMEIPFNPIDNMHDRTDILVEDLSLL